MQQHVLDYFLVL